MLRGIGKCGVSIQHVKSDIASYILLSGPEMKGGLATNEKSQALQFAFLFVSDQMQTVGR